MGIINKLVKEKTTYGIFDSIKFETLRKLSFMLIIVFMVSPALQLFSLLFFDVSIYIYMRIYNVYVLMFGIAILLIALKKLADEKKLVDIKMWVKGNVPAVLFIAFGILMIITTILNGMPEIAVSGSYYRGEGLRGHLSYLVYLFLAAFMLTPKQKSTAMHLLAKTSLFVAVVIIIDYMFLGEKYQYANRNHLIFSHYNHLGYYMLVSIMNFGMLFLTKKKLIHKLPYLFGFMSMLLALIMNDTWGCQFALFIGVIFTVIVYSVGKGKFKAITLVLVVATILTYYGAYVTDDRLKENIDDNIVQQRHDTKVLIDRDEIFGRTSGVSRIILWENALKILWEKPIIGHGADVTGKRLEAITEDNDRCHCEYLNYAISYGIPTATIYTAPFLFIMLGIGYVREEEQ